MKRVIVTADDFGRDRHINRAVIQGHQQGIVTCASLMVAGEAAAEAVELARRHPTLKVGLHLVLADGRAILPPERIPDLVDINGRFARHPASAGWVYFFSCRARRQLAAECEAQIRHFRSTGLVMDHLNCHHHLHIHPTIARIVVRLARKNDIPAIRLPFQGLRTLTRRTAAMAAVMLPWVLHLKRCLVRAGMAHNREIFGLYETGAMTEAAWLRLIPKLKPGVTEIFCHPAAAGGAGEPNPCHREYKALLNAGVKRRLMRDDIILTTFSDAFRKKSGRARNG